MRTPRLDVPEMDQIPQFRSIVDDLLLRNNVFLVGPKGTGKTTLAETMAYVIQGRQPSDDQEAPFVTINCQEWTSPLRLIGGQTINGYEEGGIIEAWRDGKLLILDEMPKLNANTAGILNDALAKSGQDGAIIFNGQGEPIKKHPEFGCIATGNVVGKGQSHNYVGNNKQDDSLLDRFAGCIYDIGYNEELERAVVYSTVADICIKARTEILRHEGRDNHDGSANDSEDAIGLRAMINLERGFELEMLRTTGIKDKNGVVHQPVEGGKTLKMGLESYFRYMDVEKAKTIKTNIGLDGFFNSYKGKDAREQFKREYALRHNL